MKNKKNPARFCIQFDMNNSKHREAVSYLNDKGRNTAEYIANTICFYESNMFGSKVVKDREMPPSDCVKSQIEMIFLLYFA